MKDERSENYDPQALEGALRELAARLERCEAPLHVEARLRAAFRQERVPPLESPVRWRELAALPVAAAMLLALGLALVRRSPEPPPARAAADEIATDFFPLAYGPSLGPGDQLQIVRVRLPRSAMVTFGLPVNPDGAEERVQADVVFGSDGLARAIRFVR